MYVTQTRVTGCPINAPLRYIGRVSMLSKASGDLIPGTSFFKREAPIAWTYGATQTTMSWRTAKSLPSTHVSKAVSGKDMINLIRSGYDISVTDGGPGVWDDVIDRRSSTEDYGHEFRTDKTVMHGEGDDTHRPPNMLKFNAFISYNSSWWRRLEYWGFAPKGYSPNGIDRIPVLDFPTDTQRVIDGTQLVTMASPTNPVAETMQNLAELVREGMPVPGKTALQGRSTPSKTYGATLLEVEFGLRPVVSWIKSMHTAITKRHEIISSLERNSGKGVRRKRTLYERVKNELVYEGPMTTLPKLLLEDSSINVSSFLDVSDARVTVTDEKYSHCYFSGSFTYYLKDVSNTLSAIERSLQELNILFGTTVDIDVLWEVTPYSWLVDYFGNFGQIFANASDISQYSQVMKYGYVMHHESVRRTILMSRARAKGYGTLLPPIVLSDVEVFRKTRMRANPYGFGVTLDQLNSKQLAILAALGLTKVGGSLNP